MSRVVSGWIKEYENSEGESVLWLDSQNEYDEHEETLTERLEFFTRKRATVRYYSCDKKFTEEEAQDYFIRKLYGDIDCEYDMAYSECTGYLWTDESLKVGGHDLLRELYSHVGKYVMIVVDVDTGVEKERQDMRIVLRNKGYVSLLKQSASGMGMTFEEYLDFLNDN